MRVLMFFIVILLALAVVVGIVVLVIINKIKNSSAVNSIIDIAGQLAENQQLEEQTKPKSIASMTNIYLPEIQQDFPDFNFFEFITVVENTLTSAFITLETQDIKNLIQVSDKLKESILLEINNDINSRKKQFYKDIKIHDTEITHYSKKQGSCVITLQSSLEYTHWVEQNDRLIKGNSTVKKQTRYNSNLIYVQDVNTYSKNGETAVGNNCPNCGASISSVGNNVCQYCGSGIQQLQLKIWSLDNYDEV